MIKKRNVFSKLDFSLGGNMHASIKSISAHRIRQLSIVLLVMAWASPSLAQEGLPPAQKYGGVEYVTGGIGFDESSAFKEAMSNYPLALVFSSDSGAYVADVDVVIRDHQDNTVLNGLATGPYFLVRIPSGEYEVFATYNFQTQSQKVTVGESGTVRKAFRWK